MLLTAWLPDFTPVLKLRGFLLRPVFKRCGPNLQIARNAHIGFSINIEIGRDVFIGYGAWIQGAGGIVIEDEVLIAPYAVLIAGNHKMQNGSYRFENVRAPIRIGKGSWISAHATVTCGVTIGEGVLLAANAVATKDIPSYCIAGGVPAQVLRQDVRKEVTA